MGSRKGIHMLFECLFSHLCKIEFHESKQNDTFINMDAWIWDKPLSQCHTGPIALWWDIVISESGEEKRMNQRKMIKDRSTIWPSLKCCSFSILFFRLYTSRDSVWTKCTQQRSWIKHDLIKAKHAENTGKVRKNQGRNYGRSICQECTN